MAWCEKFEMDASMCAHCLGHTDAPEKVPAQGPDFNARHPGICGHCDERFTAGTTVCAAIVEGERVWVVSSHAIR